MRPDRHIVCLVGRMVVSVKEWGNEMTMTRTAVVAAAMAAAAVGLAGPASAEPLSGSYTETLIEGGMAGFKQQLMATSCGPDCTHLQIGVKPDNFAELHQQGDSWIGTRPQTDGQTCTVSINMNSLVNDENCPAAVQKWQLTKNG